MVTVAFIGTFDPFHGAHLGQILRAYKHRPYSQLYILIVKRPIHKPHVTDWKHRRTMIQLTLDHYELPFDYTIQEVESPTADDMAHLVDYKICGVDSLINNLQDARRIHYAQRWPMIVLSVPGIKKQQLDDQMNAHPETIKKTVRYEYVSAKEAPLINFDFARGKTDNKALVHSTLIRSGQNTEFLSSNVKTYIQKNNLYRSDVP